MARPRRSAYGAKEGRSRGSLAALARTAQTALAIHEPGRRCVGPTTAQGSCRTGTSRGQYFRRTQAPQPSRGETCSTVCRQVLHQPEEPHGKVRRLRRDGGRRRRVSIGDRDVVGQVSAGVAAKSPLLRFTLLSIDRIAEWLQDCDLIGFTELDERAGGSRLGLSVQPCKSSTKQLLMFGVQGDDAVDVLRHASSGPTPGARGRNDHVRQPRERRVLCRREECRRVRPASWCLGQRNMHMLAVELVASERKRARQADGAEHLQGVSPRLRHNSPLRIRSEM